MPAQNNRVDLDRLIATREELQQRLDDLLEAAPLDERVPLERELAAVDALPEPRWRGYAAYILWRESRRDTPWNPWYGRKAPWEPDPGPMNLDPPWPATRSIADQDEPAHEE